MTASYNDSKKNKTLDEFICMDRSEIFEEKKPSRKKMKMKRRDAHDKE